MATQLLFTDIRVAAELLVNKLWLPGCRKGKKEVKKNFKRHFFTYPSDNSNATSCKHLLDHFFLFFYFLSLTQEHTYLCISMTFNEFSILKLDQPIKYSNFILM